MLLLGVFEWYIIIWGICLLLVVFENNFCFVFFKGSVFVLGFLMSFLRDDFCFMFFKGKYDIFIGWFFDDVVSIVIVDKWENEIEEV